MITAFRVTRTLSVPCPPGSTAGPGEVPVSDVPTISAEAAMAELDELEGPAFQETERSEDDVKTDH